MGAAPSNLLVLDLGLQTDSIQVGHGTYEWHTAHAQRLAYARNANGTITTLDGIASTEILIFDPGIFGGFFSKMRGERDLWMSLRPAQNLAAFMA